MYRAFSNLRKDVGVTESSIPQGIKKSTNKGNLNPGAGRPAGPR
jgi:hypothetical protein